MLWDYLKDHPTDIRTACYLLIACFPERMIRLLRGKI